MQKIQVFQVLCVIYTAYREQCHLINFKYFSARLFTKD